MDETDHKGQQVQRATTTSKFVFLVLAGALWLAACGGGSSRGNDNTGATEAKRAALAKVRIREEAVAVEAISAVEFWCEMSTGKRVRVRIACLELFPNDSRLDAGAAALASIIDSESRARVVLEADGYLPDKNADGSITRYVYEHNGFDVAEPLLWGGGTAKLSAATGMNPAKFEKYNQARLEFAD